MTSATARPSGWSYPFAEPGRPAFSRRHWLALILPSPPRAPSWGSPARSGRTPQFLLVALAPAAWWGLRRAGRVRPARTAALGLAAALAAQALVLLPWFLLQRHLGKSGVFAAPVVYYAFFDGIRRHDGFEVSEALRRDPDPPPLSA